MIFVEQFQQILVVLVGIVFVLGLLCGTIRWAVYSGLDPLLEDIKCLRHDLKALRYEVRREFRYSGDRTARLEGKFESTNERLHWLDRVEVKGTIQN